MSAKIVTFSQTGTKFTSAVPTLPAAELAPGSVPAAVREPILPPDAYLRVGVHSASKVLRNFIPNPDTNTKRLARVVARCVVSMAPIEWTVADLVEWLTTAGAQDGDQ